MLSIFLLLPSVKPSVDPRLVLVLFCSWHCLKCVLTQSYFAPYFPAFGLNTEINGVSLRIQSEYGKVRTRITPNMNIFYTVSVFDILEFESILTSRLLNSLLIKLESRLNWSTKLEFGWSTIFFNSENSCISFVLFVVFFFITNCLKWSCWLVFVDTKDQRICLVSLYELFPFSITPLLEVASILVMFLFQKLIIFVKIKWIFSL